MPTTKTTFHWSSLANALRVRDLVRGLLPAREAAPARHLALAEGAVHSLHVREPLEITALAGEVLVTAERDPEDHVIPAAGRFRTTRRGHHVVYALKPSRVRVGPA